MENLWENHWQNDQDTWRDCHLCQHMWFPKKGGKVPFLVYLDDINHEKVGQISWKPCDMGVKNLESNHNF